MMWVLLWEWLWGFLWEMQWVQLLDLLLVLQWGYLLG
jgi:hypothetical protein